MNKFDKERYIQLKMFDKEYHILSLSDRKKSTTLAFLLKNIYPYQTKKIEYTFSELGEKYYVNKKRLCIFGIN